MTSTRECLRFAPMLSARPGELPRADEDALHAHLAGCDACQARLADAVATDGLVAEALLAEAARVDFAPFVDQVMARVGRPAGPLGSPGRSGGFLGWVRGHRLLAAFSALAPAAAALVLALALTGGDDVVPALGDVEVVSEGRAPVVVTADEGPLVLFGDPDDET